MCGKYHSNRWAICSYLLIQLKNLALPLFEILVVTIMINCVSFLDTSELKDLVRILIHQGSVGSGPPGQITLATLARSDHPSLVRLNMAQNQLLCG